MVGRQLDRRLAHGTGKNVELLLRDGHWPPPRLELPGGVGTVPKQSRAGKRRASLLVAGLCWTTSKAAEDGRNTKQWQNSRKKVAVRVAIQATNLGSCIFLLFFLSYLNLARGFHLTKSKSN